jgi:hypothetical protein
MSYIISYASCSRDLTVGRQHTKETIEEAIDCACRMALANGATDTEDTRQEITDDMSYLSSDGEWGVFIGQPEDEDEDEDEDDGEDDGKCPACGEPLQDDVCQNSECES